MKKSLDLLNIGIVVKSKGLNGIGMDIKLARLTSTEGYSQETGEYYTFKLFNKVGDEFQLGEKLTLYVVRHGGE